ncbi:NIPSNAP family protein [Dactylosporangium darangshiense]|uniref:NIPSNAP domain-containing protein n=1 Tax=Dactylosporangium darangshiense TaxID=579108 RepID=A0ABP8DCZ7_9ACTN
MIVEFRTYRLHPGKRDEFVAFFQEEALPRMQAVGMNITGVYTSIEDPDLFAYSRTWQSEEEKAEKWQAFYESDAWLGGMFDKSMSLQQSFTAFFGTPTDKSPNR